MLTIALACGGRDNVLPRLDNHPVWSRLPVKTTQTAASMLVSIAQQQSVAILDAVVRADLDGDVAEYVKMNGPRPNVGDEHADNWDEGLDDVVSKRLEPFEKVLSANWLGINTIDTRAQNDTDRDRIVKSFAAEAWKEMTYNRTDIQILAGVGILPVDLEMIPGVTVGASAPATPEPKEYDPMRVNAILNAIILNFPDEATLEETLDLVSDDDDGLALGAAQTLGITMDDALVLREARKRSGAAVEAWVNAITAGEMLDEDATYVDLDPVDPDAIPASLVRNPDPVTGQPMPPPPKPAAAAAPPPPPPPVAAGPGAPPPPPPVVTTGAAPPAPKRGRKAATPDAPPADAIPKETLLAIKQASGMKDDDMAVVLGVSRPSFNNMVNGKQFCTPSDDRRLALRQLVHDKLTALTEAYSKL